ncbi:hypothetical protein PG984_007053 [Apiospora sp. TS-2023a]
MQFFGFVVLLSLLAATPQALPTNEPPLTPRIPWGQPDGAYVIHNQGTPNELHERLPDVPESSRLEYASRRTEILPRVDTLSKRDVFPENIACGCVNLNHADCDNATHDLEAQADGSYRELHRNECMYSIRGSVVAFDCSYGLVFDSRAEELRRAWDYVSRHCGRYKAGTFGVRTGFGTGYMTSDHRNFGGDAWGSPRSSC